MALKRDEMSIMGALFYAFPDAYFLSRDIMCRAGRDFSRILSDARVKDQSRLERIVTERITRHEKLLTGGKGKHLPAARTFNFKEYRSIEPQMAPTSFICNECGAVFDLGLKDRKGELRESDFRCWYCKKPLSQVVHVFVHPPCGNIVEIRPTKCFNCGDTYMKLNLVKASFGKSSWKCPKCGNAYQLVQYCRNCGTGKDIPRMRPMPAASAVKPMSMSAVDVSSDWEVCIDDWFVFGGRILEEKILDEIKDEMIREAVQEKMAKDVSYRERLIAEYKERHPSERSRDDIIREEIGEISEDTKAELSEYMGARENIAPDGGRPPGESALLERNFGVRVNYLGQLPLVTMVYGYLVGSTNEEISKLQLFDAGLGNYNILTHCYESEALLIELMPEKVVEWLAKRGHKIDVDSLRRILLTQRLSETYQLVRDLLHTVSHLLIRQSEIFSGISRDSLSEMVFPSAMAFLIFSTEGTELGALRTTFEAKMPSWFHMAKYAAENCPYDPLCASHDSACHGCLYIAERSCNNYFNRYLDRKVVVSIADSIGYWR